MRRHRWFLIPVIVSLLSVLDGQALAGDEFRGINAFLLLTSADMPNLELVTKDEVREYIEDVSYLELRSKLPQTVRLFRLRNPVPGAAPDAILEVDVFLRENAFRGYYGVVTLRVSRTTTLTLYPGSSLLCSVYDRQTILYGPPDGIKSLLKEAVESMIVNFASDFYKARPDLQ